MPSITSIVATTETEALNYMLSVIGEAPVASIDTATGADVVTAKAILKNTAREVLREGWKFNTEFGLELAPNGTLAWEGSDGSEETLSVWHVPTNLAKFTLSPIAAQIGLDLVERLSAAYQTGDPAANVLVFYDRLKNRDGLEQGQYPLLYIDPVWYFDFNFCPDSIRTLITVIAARRLAAQAVNSESRVKLTQQDEIDARRAARREQKPDDRYNMLNEISVGAVLGRRPYRGGGVLSIRNSPRKV